MPIPHRTVARSTLTALCLLVHGCSEIDGGAVELSWKLHAASGAERAFLDCNIEGIPLTKPIEFVRLEWVVTTMSGSEKCGDTEEKKCPQWRCTDFHGVTSFDLPSGNAQLWVTPICPFNVPADPSTYTAPAPETRKVVVGNTISLGAVELVLEVASCDVQPCICQ